MASQARANANHANARKSTGPRTPEGKARVALNALKTGIYSESAIIHGEKPADLAQLTCEWHASHPPLTPEIRSILDNIIRADWRSRRLDKVESQYWDYIPTRQSNGNEEFRLAQAFDNASEKIARLDRIITSNQRRLNADLDKLARLEAGLALELAPQPAEITPDDSIGFVPSNQPEPAPPPPEAPSPEAAPTPAVPPQPTETKPDNFIGFVSSFSTPEPHLTRGYVSIDSYCNSNRHLRNDEEGDATE